MENKYIPDLDSVAATVTATTPELKLVEESDEELTNFFEDSFNEKCKREAVENRINQAKKFYLINYNYQINLLNNLHESALKLRNSPGFTIGSRYKYIVDNLETVELLVQLINERAKIRSVCRIIFFHRSCFETETKVATRLIRKYISENVEKIRNDLELELNEAEWALLVFKKRFNYIRNLLDSKLGDKFDYRLINNYDNVFDFCMKNYDELFVIKYM